nr:hypothetical protein [Tanacetum cinerariifolium]
MSTRSSSNLLPPSTNPESIIRNRRRNLGDPSLILDFEEINMANISDPDLRPMEELLQEPTNGVRDAIVNGLNQSDQDSLNSAAVGNFLTRNTQEALTINENKSKVCTSRNKSQDSSASGSSSQNDAITALDKQVEALVSSMSKPIHSIQDGCETCGGPHPYYECHAVGGYTQDVYATSGTYNSGVGPSVPPPPLSSSFKEVEQDPKMITNPILTESTTRVPPLIVQPSPAPRPYEIPPPPTSSSSSELPKQNPHQPLILYPSRLNKEKLQDKSDIQVHKFLQMFKKLHFNISLAEALSLMPNNSFLEEFADELALLDLFPRGNEDDNFDPEADLREIEYLLNRDPSIDSSPTTVIDIIDPIFESFTDGIALVYLSPPGDDDDDLFDLKSDNDEWKKLLYGDHFNDTDSKKDKIKDSKTKSFILLNQMFFFLGYSSVTRLSMRSCLRSILCHHLLPEIRTKFSIQAYSFL